MPLIGRATPRHAWVSRVRAVATPHPLRKLRDQGGGRYAPVRLKRIQAGQAPSKSGWEQ